VIETDGTPRRAPWVRAVLLCLAGVCAAGFVALGIWQLERRAWKHALIEAVETRAYQAPQSPPDPAQWSQITAARDAYRRITVRGRYQGGKDALVMAVTDRGSGYWVLTPLDTGRERILINRGFIAQDQRTNPPATPTGDVTVTGLLRISEPDGGFLRSNDPAAGRWFSRDVVAIGDAQHLGTIAPYFIDADGSANAPGQPVGGLTVLAFTDNHMVYALTWFGLAMLSCWAGYRVWRGKDEIAAA
jgi:surfeit locus 1 family protein